MIAISHQVAVQILTEGEGKGLATSIGRLSSHHPIITYSKYALVC